MLRPLTFATAALLTVVLASAGFADDKTKNPNLGKLRHVVLFKFKQDTTPEQVKAIEDAFRALPGKIPEIVDFEWGTDVSTEGKAQSFTHCFLVTFRDAAGRAVYLPHPAHKEFGKLVGPLVADVFVIDFRAK